MKLDETMRKKRGQLLYKGETGKHYDTIRGKIGVFIANFFSICLMITFAYLTVRYSWMMAGSSILLLLIWIYFACIFLLLLFACGGIDISGIYENGISSAHHHLIDFLFRKTFHKYEDITKIGYGTLNRYGKNINFLTFYEKNLKKPSITCFREDKYTNDFYKKLISTLKEKVSNIEWVEIDYRSLPFTRK